MFMSSAQCDLYIVMWSISSSLTPLVHLRPGLMNVNGSIVMICDMMRFYDLEMTVKVIRGGGEEKNEDKF